MSEQKKSSRRIYADRVAKKIPVWLGRTTYNQSNSQLKRIGLTVGVSR